MADHVPIASGPPAPPAPDDLEDLLEFASGVARRAGALVAAGYEAAHVETHKGHAHNLVTEVDSASEALIVDALAARFPLHSARAEEGGRTDAGEVTWVIDPLDGTNNFAHGFPFFCVSLAAMLAGEILAGVTFDPLRDELFAAARSCGATLNGRALGVSARASLETSLVITGFPYDKATNPDNNLREFAAVMPRVRGIRRTGSAALDLAYVAAGRAEAYWERGTSAWDVAAGILFVAEAGGRITDLDGAPPEVDGGRFLASNGLVHDELLALLVAARA